VDNAHEPAGDQGALPSVVGLAWRGGVDSGLRIVFDSHVGQRPDRDCADATIIRASDSNARAN